MTTKKKLNLLLNINILLSIVTSIIIFFLLYFSNALNIFFKVTSLLSKPLMNTLASFINMNSYIDQATAFINNINTVLLVIMIIIAVIFTIISFILIFIMKSYVNKKFSDSIGDYLFLIILSSIHLGFIYYISQNYILNLVISSNIIFYFSLLLIPVIYLIIYIVSFKNIYLKFKNHEVHPQINDIIVKRILKFVSIFSIIIYSAMLTLNLILYFVSIFFINYLLSFTHIFVHAIVNYSFALLELNSPNLSTLITPMINTYISSASLGVINSNFVPQIILYVVLLILFSILYKLSKLDTTINTTIFIACLSALAIILIMINNLVFSFITTIVLLIIVTLLFLKAYKKEIINFLKDLQKDN